LRRSGIAARASLSGLSRGSWIMVASAGESSSADLGRARAGLAAEPPRGQECIDLDVRERLGRSGRVSATTTCASPIPTGTCDVVAAVADHAPEKDCSSAIKQHVPNVGGAVKRCPTTGERSPPPPTAGSGARVRDRVQIDQLSFMAWT